MGDFTQGGFIGQYSQQQPQMASISQAITNMAVPPQLNAKRAAPVYPYSSTAQFMRPVRMASNRRTI